MLYYAGFNPYACDAAVNDKHGGISFTMVSDGNSYFGVKVLSRFQENTNEGNRHKVRSSDSKVSASFFID